LKTKNKNKQQKWKKSRILEEFDAKNLGFIRQFFLVGCLVWSGQVGWSGWLVRGASDQVTNHDQTRPGPA
jgi:hypothetical protein